MTRSIRRWLLPPVVAASMLMLAAGSAFASDSRVEATVSVFNTDGTPAGSTVCGFFFEFSTVASGETGEWELRDSGGAVVEHGSYDVTSSSTDRVPDSGSFALANGTYTLVWDDEAIDLSFESQDIVVHCEAATATPTTAPTPTFHQSVAGFTDVPKVTQPNTSTIDQSGTDGGALTGTLLAMLGLAALVLVLAPRPHSRRR